MDLTLNALVETVGADAFRAGAARAWASAKDIGLRVARERPRDSVNRQADFDLFYEAVNEVLANAQGPSATARLLFDLYRQAPSFTIIDQVYLRWSELSPEMRAAFWDEARRVLSQEAPVLSNPLQYALWCDFFENEATVRESWLALTAPGLGDRGIERVLIHSGPVPYPLKQALYDRLVGDERWHYHIFRSLLHSFGDVYGKLDVGLARRTLEMLHLPPETEHLATLRRALEERPV